ESDDVEVAERGVALERHEQQVARAEQRLHVRPGGVGALGSDVGPPVQDVVEDLQPEVRLRDLVDLRKREREAQPGAVLAYGTPLVAEITAGLFDEWQQPLVRLAVRARHQGRPSIGSALRWRKRRSPTCPASGALLLSVSYVWIGDRRAPRHTGDRPRDVRGGSAARGDAQPREGRPGVQEGP